MGTLTLYSEYRSRFSSEATVSFCLRVMVGVIILYDYVHPVGAFAKSSKIDVSKLYLQKGFSFFFIPVDVRIVQLNIAI